MGMRIVEVNGISLLGASHSQAVKALKSSNTLLITVCDGFDVQEVMRRKSLADTLEDDTVSSVTVGSHGEGGGVFERAEAEGCTGFKTPQRPCKGATKLVNRLYPCVAHFN